MLMSRYQQLIIPLFEKEVDELLAKGAIEPCFGGAGSSLSVVPKHTVASDPYLT